jgi:hypothetical protein
MTAGDTLPKTWRDEITVHPGTKVVVSRLELACLRVLDSLDDEPTTFTVVAEVFRVARDARGDRIISDAQHIAVKRALSNLRRRGWISGWRVGDGNRCCRWLLHRLALAGLKIPKRQKAQQPGVAHE